MTWLYKDPETGETLKTQAEVEAVLKYGSTRKAFDALVKERDDALAEVWDLQREVEQLHAEARLLVAIIQDQSGGKFSLRGLLSRFSR